jgi:glutamyl-Q tRNA(Asp) synthetase
MGSLVAALASYLLAKQQLGKWIIRVEDLDPPREKTGMAEQQIKTLQELGLVSDDEIVWQSNRTAFYEYALTKLLFEDKAFYCSCSRQQLQQHNGIHRYCQNSVTSQQSSIRLRMPDLDVSFEDAIYGVQMQNLGRDVGDMVLKRADGYFAYQLAVVIDDAEQEITQIVRGADLLDSSLRQIYLQKQLGYSTPKYAHIPLVLDKNGQKLSKSLWAKALDEEDRFAAFQSAYFHLGQNIEVINRRQSVEARLQAALTHFDANLIQHIKAHVQHGSQ